MTLSFFRDLPGSRARRLPSALTDGAVSPGGPGPQRGLEPDLSQPRPKSELRQEAQGSACWGLAVLSAAVAFPEQTQLETVCRAPQR